MYRHNNVFGQKPRCPAIFREKWPKLGKNGTFFTKNGGAPRFLPKNVVMPIHPLDPTQNYNSTLAFLKIPPSGRKRGPFPQDLAAKLPKKEGTVTKKGGKKFFPTKMVTFIRCKIWCRLWFCHQTWSNFMIWLTYGHSKLMAKKGKIGSTIP